MSADPDADLDPRDADRLLLLDRIAERMPDLDLDQHEVAWHELPEDCGGGEALLVDGGGIDGGSGAYFVNAGDDLHVVGSLAPLVAAVGCIVVKADGSRRLAEVVPDPLAAGGWADS